MRSKNLAGKNMNISDSGIKEISLVKIMASFVPKVGMRKKARLIIEIIDDKDNKKDDSK